MNVDNGRRPYSDEEEDEDLLEAYGSVSVGSSKVSCGERPSVAPSGVVRTVVMGVAQITTFLKLKSPAEDTSVQGGGYSPFFIITPYPRLKFL